MRGKDLVEEEWNRKNERLFKWLREVLGIRARCPNCETEFFTKKLYQEQLMDWISMSEDHPVNQLNDKEEIAYLTCPNCEESVDFRKTRFLNEVYCTQYSSYIIQLVSFSHLTRCPCLNKI